MPLGPNVVNAPTLLVYPLLPALGVAPFLPGVAFPFVWTPIFFNQAQKAISGASIDISLASTPLHEFEISYTMLRSPANFAEFQQLFGLFTAVHGSRGRFLFDNPYDDSVVNQAVGVGDGSTTTFLVVRTLSAAQLNAAPPLPERVGQVNVLSNVSVNGVSQTLGSGPGGTWVDASTPGANVLTFSVPPPAGQVVTMSMTYYYYCKFKDDTLPFSNFAFGYWDCKAVKIQSCRAGT